MVCLRGESLTHHTNQMKLFKTLAATAAVITCCIGNPIPAEASIHTDVRSGRTLNINDGIPDHYLNDYQTGRSVVREGDRGVAYPVQGGLFW